MIERSSSGLAPRLRVVSNPVKVANRRYSTTQLPYKLLVNGHTRGNLSETKLIRLAEESKNITWF